jgi:2-methylcitrate dehydratase
MAGDASHAGPHRGDRKIAGHRGPSRVEELARFVSRSRWEGISEPAREQLQLRVLDSLGVALGALDGEPVEMVREQAREFGGAPLCTLIGAGRGAPGRAAFSNGALVRYLDFNDSYLAPGET